MEYVIAGIVTAAALVVLLAARLAHGHSQPSPTSLEPGAWAERRRRLGPWLWAAFALLLVGLSWFSWYVTAQGMWSLAVLAPILLAYAGLRMFRRGQLFPNQPWANWARLGITLLLAAASFFGWSAGGQQRVESPPVPNRQVSLYYYSPALDQDESGNPRCSFESVSPVPRSLPLASPDVIADTVRLLIAGQLTPAERQSGLTTEFPLPGLRLVASSQVGDTVTLTFADPQAKTTGGSCRVTILWSQIAATVRQFPGVREVRFWPEELFQP